MFKRLMFLSLAALVLQGCAVTTQDTSLARRTAHTLGADPDQITISKVDKGLQRIDYQATYNGASYNCYVTVMLATSDAMCTKRGGNTGGNTNSTKKKSPLRK